MKTATFLKSLGNFQGDGRLYQLSEPIDYDNGSTSYVAVSAVVAMSLWGDAGGPETFIFACDGSGKVLDWTELPGSFKGALDHERALKGAGYKVAVPA